MKLDKNKINWLHVFEIALFIGALVFSITMFIRVINNANLFYQNEMKKPEIANHEFLATIGRSNRIATVFVSMFIIILPLLCISVICFIVNRSNNILIDKMFIILYSIIVGVFLTVWLSNLNALSNISDNKFVWSLRYAFRSAVGLSVY